LEQQQQHERCEIYLFIYLIFFGAMILEKDLAKNMAINKQNHEKI
jgi:hypothetical protein